MLASIFGVTGLIVWIVVIVAVIALLKGKNKTLILLEDRDNIKSDTH